MSNLDRENRALAYIQLIRKLWSCRSKEEIFQVLNANGDLVDGGLVQIMRQSAEVLLQKGNRNDAEYLINLARYVNQYLESLPIQSPGKAQADRLLNLGIQQFQSSQFREAIESWLQAVAIYREIGDRNGEASSLNNLGHAYYYLGQYQKAIEYYQQCLTITREMGDRRGEASSLIGLGNAYHELGQHQKAIEYYQQCLTITREIGDRRGEAKSLNNLGSAYYYLRQYQKALEYYQQCLTIAREIGDRRGEAKSLNNLGSAYYYLGQYQKVLEYEQQCLKIQREIGDRGGEAYSLDNLGSAYYYLRQYQKALEYYQQCLTIAREIGDRGGEASCLNNLGNVYNSLGQYQKAIDFLQQCLTIAKEIGDRGGEANSLGNLGNAYNSLGKYQKAIEYSQQCLTITREIGDRRGEAKSLIRLGLAYNSLGQYQKAIEYSQQYLTITREIGDRRGEAYSLIGLGKAHILLGQYQKAIEYSQQCLTITREIGDRRGEAYSLSGLGNAYDGLGKYQKAIEYYQQSLTIDRKMGDRGGEANSLSGLGSAYNYLGQYQKAIDFHQQCLTIKREIGDRRGEANSLNNLGNAYYYLGQYQKAIEYHQQSLKIQREIGDRGGEANSLGGLGHAYYYLGQYQKAIDFLQQSLTITRELGDRRGETNSLLLSLGNAYDALGQYQKALDFYQQSLTIVREIGSRNGEANSLNNLGNAYYLLGQYQKALDFYQQSLTIVREIGSRNSEANSLNNLGNAYDSLGQYQKAIDFYQQSLTIVREIGSRNGEASSLNNLGNAYHYLGQYQKALEYYQQSLTIVREIGSRNGEANSLNNLGRVYRKLQQIPSAIQNFQNCLKIATPATMPKECLAAGSNLGNIEFTAGNWQLAIKSYTTAIEAVEQSYNWSITDERRQEILKESISIYENIVQCYVNVKQYDKALEYADRSRSKNLLDLMASNDLYSSGEISPELEQLSLDYDELQQRINAIRFRSQSEENKQLVAGATRRVEPRKTWEADIKVIEELESQKQELWRQMRKLDPVVAGGKQVDPLNLKQMQELIKNSSTAVLSFYTTRNDTHIFILRQSQTPQLFTCEGQGLEALQQWIFNNWLDPYIREYATWRNNMEKILQEISQRLQLNDLISQHLTDIQELIIVPHLALHQIPFSALPLSDSSLSAPVNSPELNSQRGQSNIEQVNSINLHGIMKRLVALALTEVPSISEITRALGGRRKTKPSPTPNIPTSATPKYLGERFRIRILPSLQILNYCHQRPNIEQQLMGIIEDATSDLYFTSYECEQIAKLYSVQKENRLKGDEATTSNYKNLVKEKKINKLHSSHHANFNPIKPLESLLLLADGSLPLGQIIAPGWRMPNLVDVFLSCCETNLTTPEITDNILTIATGFLCAGARSVVSTLWAVDDLATALFLLFYYQERQQSTSRSEALQKAQARLRNLTGTELATKYKSQIEETLQQRLNQATTNEEKEKIQRSIISLKFRCQQDLPFVHPVYWAGFISQGLE